MNLKHYVFMLAAATALSACTMAPWYQQPQVPLTANWPQSEMLHVVHSNGDVQTVAETPWQSYFGGAELQQLIQLALDHNADYRTAVLNVQRAKALYGVQRAELIPNINAQGTASKQRMPEQATDSGTSETSELYQANLAATAYELDLFGRVRSLNTAALQSYFATQEAQRAVQLSLITAVAQSYVAYLEAHELLNITEQTLKNREKAFDIVNNRFTLGAGSAIDAQRAKSALASAKAAKQQYQRQLMQAENALTLLVGTPVADVLGAQGSLAAVQLPNEVPVGLPADVLNLRPDVQQAEHQLRAANGNVGAARAAFFPRITLTGTLGFASTSLDNLFSGGASGAWSFSPAITLPIFNGGANISNLGVANAEQEIAVVNYQNAVQSAFRETADALAGYATFTEQLNAQAEQLQANEKVFAIAEARYNQGVDDSLSMLDAQRELFGSQQAEINTRAARLNNLALLYKVLSGGTTVPPAEPAN